MFEEIDHTADLAIRVQAASLADLFCEACKGLMALSGIELADKPIRSITLHLQADDPETLLVSWLEELLYFIESKAKAYRRCQIEMPDDISLTAEIDLVPIANIGRMIKAVTFHDLEIQRLKDHVETVIVFDV